MWSYLGKLSGMQKPVEEEKKEPPKKDKQKKGGDSLKTVDKDKKKMKQEGSGGSSSKNSTTTSQARSAKSTSSSQMKSQQSSQMSKTMDPSKALLVKGFVEATLSLGVKGLVSEFRGRKRTLEVSNMKEFVAQQPNGFNRYKDVGCLDATRVKLSLGPVAYIHANYVATPKNPKRFICTQAPMQTTCAHFWNMMVQEKSNVILMLCNLYERGAPKCAPYFPQEAGATVTFANGDVKVVAKTRNPFPFPLKTNVKIFVTQMEVTVKGKEPHSCTHYHWMDWPDRGVPEADMAPIQLLNSLKHNDNPIVVHCSAGIGRTGSAVLLQHVLELLNEKKEVGPMVNYMDELRKQRHNSVQTEHQYLYVHMVLLLYMKKTGYLENSVEANKRLETFHKEYKTTCAAFG